MHNYTIGGLESEEDHIYHSTVFYDIREQYQSFKIRLGFTTQGDGMRRALLHRTVIARTQDTEKRCWGKEYNHINWNRTLSQLSSGIWSLFLPQANQRIHWWSLSYDTEGVSLVLAIFLSWSTHVEDYFDCRD